MPFAIEAERKTQIDEKYIGFGPYTSRVNPAHLANGLFRAAVGQTFDTELLNRFVFWQQADGRIPPGH